MACPGIVRTAQSVKSKVDTNAGTANAINFTRYELVRLLTEALVESWPALETMNPAQHVDDSVHGRANAGFGRDVATSVDIFLLV